MGASRRRAAVASAAAAGSLVAADDGVNDAGDDGHALGRNGAARYDVRR